jgi:hypothetical protein
VGGKFRSLDILCNYVFLFSLPSAGAGEVDICMYDYKYVHRVLVRAIQLLKHSHSYTRSGEDSLRSLSLYPRRKPSVSGSPRGKVHVLVCRLWRGRFSP